ncbi:MAG: peptidylprolyl isomerase [Pirellulaceae bacterium]
MATRPLPSRFPDRRRPSPSGSRAIAPSRLMLAILALLSIVWPAAGQTLTEPLAPPAQLLTPIPSAPPPGTIPPATPTAAIGPFVGGSGVQGGDPSVQQASSSVRMSLGDNRAKLDPAWTGKLFRPTRVLAIVGNEMILEADVRTMIEPMLHKNKDRIPEERWDEMIEQLLRPALSEHIKQKSLSQRFIRDMVGAKPPKEYQEAMKKMSPRLSEAFYGKYLPKLMKDYEVETQLELEYKLRDMGSSLAAQQKIFRDTVLAQQALEQHVPEKPSIELADLRDYYDAHQDQWDRKARVRFRLMSVHFEKHSDRQEAFQQIADMGNEVVFGGAKFEAVAKRRSEGPFANEGGLFAWTSKGSLRSQVIESIVFEIPPGQLSEILEDEEGFHIVEVLEREDARTQPMEEVQQEIRKTLVKQKRNDAEKNFVRETILETNIWTRWPNDIPGSRPLEEAIPDP